MVGPANCLVKVSGRLQSSSWVLGLEKAEKQLTWRIPFSKPVGNRLYSLCGHPTDVPYLV